MLVEYQISDGDPEFLREFERRKYGKQDAEM